MKILILCLFFILTSAQASEFFKIKSKPYLLYKTIPFVKAANFKRYVEQVSRNLNRERQIQHAYLANLVNLTGDIQSSIDAVSAIESLSEYSSKISTQGFETYFSSQLISHISSNYREYNLKKSNLNLTQDASQANLIAAGTFSIAPTGLFSISLELVNLDNKVVESFHATGDYKKAISSISYQVFKFFEETRAVPLKNPTPSKRWVTSSPLNFKIKSTKQEASDFCNAQGARIPTARELKTAHLMSTIGGGVVLPRYKFVHVQDQDKYGDNLYYYTSQPNSGKNRVQRWISDVINDLAYFVCIKDM